MGIATFGGGCFWCVEAVFQQLKGVTSVVSGYAGGDVENPTYGQVTSGKTGHAEVCQISFDPEHISYEELLEVFFETHDPTTLNRQGNDVGTQYRSVIFYHNEEQREASKGAKARIDESGTWTNPVVTEIVPYTEFYRAEDYHQNYFKQNPDQAYCRYVIRPKLDKFEKVFKLKLSK
jgi:peptide-methionine (S)-S-oxide reductase